MLKGEKSFSIALPAVLSNGTANELPVLTDQQNECEELRAEVKQKQGFEEERNVDFSPFTNFCRDLLALEAALF